jgi:hypothetical protein
LGSAINELVSPSVSGTINNLVKAKRGEFVDAQEAKLLPDLEGVPTMS